MVVKSTVVFQLVELPTASCVITVGNHTTTFAVNY